MIWLLDTNMLVYARNGLAKVVQRLDEAWAQGDVVTSLLVLGELTYGAEKSARKAENLAAVEQQLHMLDGILPLTTSSSTASLSAATDCHGLSAAALLELLAAATRAGIVPADLRRYPPNRPTDHRGLQCRL